MKKIKGIVFVLLIMFLGVRFSVPDVILASSMYLNVSASEVELGYNESKEIFYTVGGYGDGGTSISVSTSTGKYISWKDNEDDIESLWDTHRIRFTSGNTPGITTVTIELYRTEDKYLYDRKEIRVSVAAPSTFVKPYLELSASSIALNMDQSKTINCNVRNINAVDDCEVSARVGNSEYADWGWQDSGDLQEKNPIVIKAGKKAGTTTITFTLFNPQDNTVYDTAVLTVETIGTTPSVLTTPRLQLSVKNLTLSPNQSQVIYCNIINKAAGGGYCSLNGEVKNPEYADWNWKDDGDLEEKNALVITAGKKAGTTTVIFTLSNSKDNMVYDTAVLTVETVAPRLELSASNITLNANQTQLIYCNVKNTDLSDNYRVRGSVENPAYADWGWKDDGDLEEKNPVVIYAGKKTGTTKITFTLLNPKDNTVYDTAVVTVKTIVPSLKLSTSSITLNANQSKTIYCNINNMNSDDDYSLKQTIKNPGYADWKLKGNTLKAKNAIVIKAGKKAGTTKITFTLSDPNDKTVYSTAVLTIKIVNNTPAPSLKLSAGSVTLKAGQSKIVYLNVKNMNGSYEVSGKVRNSAYAAWDWTDDEPLQKKNAVIIKAGKKPGTTTITFNLYNSNNKKAYDTAVLIVNTVSSKSK